MPGLGAVWTLALVRRLPRCWCGARRAGA